MKRETLMALFSLITTFLFNHALNLGFLLGPSQRHKDENLHFTETRRREPSLFLHSMKFEPSSWNHHHIIIVWVHILKYFETFN
jgi:hypothetical protein